MRVIISLKLRCFSMVNASRPDPVRNSNTNLEILSIVNVDSHWWLVRATCVVDGLFFSHFFGSWRGVVRMYMNSHVEHVQGIFTCGGLSCM